MMFSAAKCRQRALQCQALRWGIALACQACKAGGWLCATMCICLTRALSIMRCWRQRALRLHRQVTPHGLCFLLYLTPVLEEKSCVRKRHVTSLATVQNSG